MALVRPDGYISLITSLDGGAAFTEFMDTFMVAPEPACQCEHMNGNGITNGNRHVNGDTLDS